MEEYSTDSWPCESRGSIKKIACSNVPVKNEGFPPGVVNCGAVNAVLLISTAGSGIPVDADVTADMRVRS
jgi:hypothetical protein